MKGLLKRLYKTINPDLTTDKRVRPLVAMGTIAAAFILAYTSAHYGTKSDILEQAKYTTISIAIDEQSPRPQDQYLELIEKWGLDTSPQGECVEINYTTKSGHEIHWFDLPYGSIGIGTDRVDGNFDAMLTRGTMPRGQEIFEDGAPNNEQLNAEVDYAMARIIHAFRSNSPETIVQNTPEHIDAYMRNQIGGKYQDEFVSFLETTKGDMEDLKYNAAIGRRPNGRISSHYFAPGICFIAELDPTNKYGATLDDILTESDL